MQHVSWPAIEAIQRVAYRVLLFGPPGTGKTRSVFETARALDRPFYNVTLTDETPAAELRGHYVPQGDVWQFMFGPAIRAATEGAVLGLDEIDKASQDALDFLHGFLNDPELARCTLPNGEIIEPQEGFKVIATMNGQYEDLMPSLQDRFSIAIEVTEPHPGAIASLPEDLQGAARNFESYDAKQRPATIRRWQQYAILRELPEIGAEIAAKAVFAHRAQELLDAISFRNAEEEPEEEPEGESFCDCESCRMKRARTWMEYHYERTEARYDSEEEQYTCPDCEGYWEEEENAVKCCYDDSEWIQYCKDNGLQSNIL